MKLTQRVIGLGIGSIRRGKHLCRSKPGIRSHSPGRRPHRTGLFRRRRVGPRGEGIARHHQAGASSVAGFSALRAPRLTEGARRSRPHGPAAAVRVLKLARELGGVLTVAQVAMELNVPLDQAQAGLDECVRAGNAFLDYDMARGHALYRFPEFVGPDRGLLSN